MMTKENTAVVDGAIGDQLDGQVLYENQKRIRSSQEYLFAPAVIATGLQMAENMGSVLRLADAAGCKHVTFLSDVESPYLKKVKKTARSSESFLVWDVKSYAEFLANDVQNFRPLIAIELTSKSTSLFESSLPQSCAFVVGSERYGIPQPILQECSHAIYIPMYGVNGSMNVTHALAIVLFEWRRQHLHRLTLD